MTTDEPSITQEAIYAHALHGHLCDTADPNCGYNPCIVHRTQQAARRGSSVVVVPTPVDAYPLFVWEATVRFSTTFNLPNNVLESAVLRAIGGADIAKVLSLRVSQFGGAGA